MSSIPNRRIGTPEQDGLDITALIPDFPFDYGAFLDKAKTSDQPLFNVPASAYGTEVVIIGAGIAGTIAAYELMRCGLKPIVLEAHPTHIGGRVYAYELGRSGEEGTWAELGGMRFPPSGKGFMHYAAKTRARMADFPNPGTSAALSTRVEYQGQLYYYEPNSAQFPLPDIFARLEELFNFQLDDKVSFQQMKQAMLNKDTAEIKRIWNKLIVPGGFKKSYDDLSFYNWLTDVAEFFPDQVNLFGQVGFGTGGWNTDFPNSMLEILRVLYTYLDSDLKLIYDGASYIPNMLFERSPSDFGDSMNHWPAGTTVKSLSEGRLGHTCLDCSVVQIRTYTDQPTTFKISYGKDGALREIDTEHVIFTPHVRVLQMLGPSNVNPNEHGSDQGRVVTLEVEEAIRYTHYMQSAKIFVELSSPFWTTRGADGKYPASVTLSDRLTRGTYLLDYSAAPGSTGKPVACLSYTWNDDALKFLPLESAERVSRCWNSLFVTDPNQFNAIYSNSVFDGSIPRNVTISWENDRKFLGAFKNNLPGQYEYQRRLFTQFMTQSGNSRLDQFVLAGDDISWTAGWAEGAATTSINAINKIVSNLSGTSQPGNPGPIDQFDQLKPVELPNPPAKRRNRSK